VEVTQERGALELQPATRRYAGASGRRGALRERAGLQRWCR